MEDTQKMSCQTGEECCGSGACGNCSTTGCACGEDEKKENMTCAAPEDATPTDATETPVAA